MNQEETKTENLMNLQIHLNSGVKVMVNNISSEVYEKIISILQDVRQDSFFIDRDWFNKSNIALVHATQSTENESNTVTCDIQEVSL